MSGINPYEKFPMIAVLLIPDMTSPLPCSSSASWVMLLCGDNWRAGIASRRRAGARLRNYSIKQRIRNHAPFFPETPVISFKGLVPGAPSLVEQG